MDDRYPGYDVLSKRDGISWNDATRKVIGERLAVRDEPVFFAHAQWLTLAALCDRILPQPAGREKILLAAYIDRKMLVHGASGTRYEPMPYDGEAWKIGLAALEIESQAAYGAAFHLLTAENADALLHRMQAGDMHDAAWDTVPPAQFFKRRILADIPAAYYAHPLAWNEIGFGGPASPRGYVRMDADRRDPWEAAQAGPGRHEQALKDNLRVR